MIFFKNRKLFIAIDNNDSGAVAELLKAGANPNARLAYDPETDDFPSRCVYPLSRAAYRNHDHIISLLLTAGADPWKKIGNLSSFDIAWCHADKKSFFHLQKYLNISMTVNDDGLHLDGHKHHVRIGLKNNDIATARTLLNEGARFGPYAEKIKSALMHQAVKDGDNNMVDLLLVHGVDLNVRQDKTLKTPLHTAIDEEKYYIAEDLLKRGADTTLKDARGLIAADLARAKGNQAIMALLKCEPEPSTQPTASPDGWILLAPNRVAHVTSEPALGRKITDIFNFATAERSYTMENTAAQTETVVLKSFTDMTDKSPAERALAELQRLGGTADPSVIYIQPRNKQPLMPGKK